MSKNKKSFVVTIGNYGSVVVLHHGNEVKTKILLEELTDEAKIDLKNLFTRNQSIPISIILDTIDQSYKRKSYPGIKKTDLAKIIKREMANDGDRESFKNFIFLENKKATKTQLGIKNVGKQECLMVSASNSEAITKWLDFAMEMPNPLKGIYMAPIESFRIYSLLKDDIKIKSSVKDKNITSICFMILQSKVSGVKQMIFSDQGIIFTRSVNYDFKSPDFLAKYEQDVYSTFEYLKRLFPEIRISEIDIVNIFSNEILDSLKKIGSSELNIINYSPADVATKLKYKKLLPDNAQFCDLLISKTFAGNKKILKFTTPKIQSLNNFFTALQVSYYLNILLIAGIILTCLGILFFDNKAKKALSEAEEENMIATSEFQRISAPTNNLQSQLTEDGNVITIERIIDFGKINEAFSKVGTDFSGLYSGLRFLKDSDVKINSFSYYVPNFNYKSPEISKKYSFSFKGDLQNKSGDIDDLFKEFDVLTSKTKKAFSGNNVQYSDIPRNIDFVQKYYTFPIEFTISDKQQFVRQPLDNQPLDNQPEQQ